MNEHKLHKKLQRLKELSTIIELHKGQILTREQKQEVDNEQFRLEFALRTLVDESKIREADLKIAAMEKIVTLITTRTHV